MTVQTLAIVVLLVSFFVMIFLRFPIAYAVGLSSVLCLMVQGQALTDVCRLMVKGISSFSLMAVPFFITMGVLMGSGGISEKLIALADACVGWMRGGMAMVNIVASYFFGGISGSASADTASIGSIMIPMMSIRATTPTSPPLSPSPPPARACWFPRATTWSSTPPPLAAFPWAACSWLATCPVLCWPSS